MRELELPGAHPPTGHAGCTYLCSARRHRSQTGLITFVVGCAPLRAVHVLHTTIVQAGCICAEVMLRDVVCMHVGMYGCVVRQWRGQRAEGRDPEARRPEMVNKHCSETMIPEGGWAEISHATTPPTRPKEQHPRLPDAVAATVEGDKQTDHRQ